MAEAPGSGGRPTVGFVGLGNMGGPMVRRLAAAGYAVRAFDVSAEAAGRLAGTPGVAVAAELGDVAHADVLVLMLPSSDVVEHVLVDQALLVELRSGAVVVDMSSSEPLRTRGLAERAREVDVTLVDAPVSGGVKGAESGTLTIMVGGPADTVERLRPLLETMGSRVRRAGDVGAGHAVKALNNLMSATHLLATAEAMAAGTAFGLDTDVVLDIVNGSSGRSGSTETKWPSFVVPGTFDSGFGLRLMLKDMRIALGLARAADTPAALSERAVTAWTAAADAVPPDADHTEIARWVRDQTPDQDKDDR